MKVKCPHCETIQNAPDDTDGKKAICKSCRGTFVLTPHSEPNTPLDNNTLPVETDWTAIWMKVVCVAAVVWVLGFACGAMLTKPNRKRVKVEIARHTKIADQERKAHDAEEEKVSRFKALNTDLRQQGEDQLAYIRKLEDRLKVLSKKIASAESAKPPKETITQEKQKEKAAIAKAKIEKEKAAQAKARANAIETEEWKKQRESSKIEAWVVAQEFVKDFLKSPSTADFGGIWGGDYQNPKTCVTEMGYDTYQVRGWVDSQNSFGGTVRTNFLLTVKDKGNENWSLVGTPIMTQR